MSYACTESSIRLFADASLFFSLAFLALLCTTVYYLRDANSLPPIERYALLKLPAVRSVCADLQIIITQRTETFTYAVDRVSLFVQHVLNMVSRRRAAAANIAVSG